MNDRSELHLFDIPGSTRQLLFQRAASGRLTRVTSDGRVYLSEDEAGIRTYGDDLAIVREVMLPNGLVRHVHAAGTSWIEEYLWDDIGRPRRIDGVEIVRDEKRRIIACRGEGAEWHYGYAGDDLAVIGWPDGVRHVTRGPSGRPVLLRDERGPTRIGYGDNEAREDVPPLPPTWHRDDVGRLWTISDDSGTVLTTYLWDGFACFGRIDGEAGEPLTAFFSLDPSCTPVRVITAAGVVRIPRDAFGELLLSHEGVPGLYGGAIYDGFVHLRSRALDPRAGSFDRPDPWDGLESDPRRAEGFAGPLLIENPECGPYAVCQYDPVGRTDPTGEVSALLVFLDFTWALQHNLAGFFGFDWTIGFWSSLLTAPVQRNGEALIKRFFDFEPLYNERTGAYALRRGTWGIDRAFTYQHLVMSSHEGFDDLKQVNVIDPTTRFEPTLYGTILRLDVTDSNPVLLRGNLDNTLRGWTRCGGAAVPVVPGTETPRFPSGGLHIDSFLKDVWAPRDCNITELTPAAAPSTANLAKSVPATDVPSGTALAAPSLVLLTDGTGAADIKTVNDVKGTHVRFLEPGLTVATNGVRLRGLGAPGASDTLNAVAAAAGRLSITGSPIAYTVGDPLKLSQGGTLAGAVLVSALEAQVTIDGPLPATLTAPLTISIGNAGGTPASGTLAGDILSSGSLPSKGDTISLTGNGVTLGAVVVAEPTLTTRQLDRTGAELAVLGAAIQWQPVGSGAVIGSAATVPATAALTYTPQTIGTAPSGNFVIVKDSASTAVFAVRAVTALGYDAIVAGSSLPGNETKPYQVIRFPFAAPDVQPLTLTIDTSLTLPAGVALTGTTLQFTTLPSTTITAGSSPVTATISGATASFGTTPPNVLPSQFVVLTNGTTLEPNVASRITATLTLDRTIAFNATAPIDVVATVTRGPAYDATLIDSLHVVVQPSVGSGSIPTQMPRFAAGNLVQIVWPGGATSVQQYIIGSVSGTTLTLIEPPDVPGGIPAPAGSFVTVQLMVVPSVPAAVTGSWRVGLHGAPVGTASGDTVTTKQITVDIWQPVNVNKNVVIAMVQGTAAHIAVIAAGPTFTVTLLTPSALTGSAQMTTFSGATFYASTFTQSGVDLTIGDVTGGALPAGPALMAVVPFAAAAGAANAQKAAMSAGTVRVPDDAEAWEVDRRKSLVFHELTHTRQAAYWGPLFMGFLPLFALELASEVFTDVELPEFSKYVAATIEIENNIFYLRIDDMQGVVFDSGSPVQIVQGQTTSSTTLEAKNGNRFQIPPNNDLNAGGVQARRQVKHNALTGTRDGTFNALQGFSLGSILNYVSGTVWGGLITGIKKLVYLVGHRLFHAGDGYAATVVDQRTIKMKDDDGRRAIQGYRKVFLKNADDTTLFDVEGTSGDTIVLHQITTMTGDVTVKPYDASDDVDGLDYWDANVADASKPAQITIKQKNGKSLKLDPFAIVSTASGAFSKRTNVTAVISANVVELEDAPSTDGTDRALRIAFVDQKDPIGSADSAFLTKYGLGWMRWLFDPYRQLQFGLDPKRNSVQDVIARIGRYAFSSHSWSAAPPAFGYLLWDDLFKQAKGKGHLSQMEQEASQESGNTYSPVGRIRGGFTKSGFATYSATVGDLARYWYTPLWSNPGDHMILQKTQLDSPGVSVNNFLVVVPTSVVPSTPTSALNSGAAPGSATPDAFVPDVFYPKLPTPNSVTFTGTPSGFSPGVHGLIPMTPTIELSIGSYVAFAQPGTHRVTVTDADVSKFVGDSDAADAREAQDAGKQTTFFDVSVGDVTVAVAGSPLSQTRPPSQITMLVMQRAVVTVTPNSGQTWALAVTQPGVVLTPATAGTALVAAGTGKESVELTRVYPANNGQYADAVLATHGVTMPVDIHVPIRSFNVTVVKTFALIASPALGAAPVTAPTPGTTAFALIPSVVLTPPQISVSYPAATPQPLIDPAPVITVVPTPAALATYIDSGAVFQFAFGAADPPEEIATITFSAVVGTSATNAPITATVAYTPFFRLTAGSFQVARGTTLILQTTPATALGTAVLLTGDPTGLTIGTNGTTVTIAVAATALTGKRRIAATSSANPTQMAVRTIEVI